jgi:hypothetical protein
VLVHMDPTAAAQVDARFSPTLDLKAGFSSSASGHLQYGLDVLQMALQFKQGRPVLHGRAGGEGEGRGGPQGTSL